MNTLIYESELEHHGVKGMKWGVHKYRKYDGSYTQRGVAKFDKAYDKYSNADAKVKQLKKSYKAGSSSKSAYKTAKFDRKVAKYDLDNSYKRLKNDKRADEGKNLYRKGKTISGNYIANRIAQTAIVAGSVVANRILSSTYDQRVANLASSAIAAGGTAVNMILAAKTASDNSKLRAYYAH